MGHSCRKNRVNIIDMTPQTKEIYYLRPRTETIIRKDNIFDNLFLETKAKC